GGRVMICKKLKSGSWECVADGPRDPVTNKRNQVRRRGKTKKEAMQRVRDEIDRQENHGVNSKVNKNVTFEQVAWEWFEVYALTGVKNSTIRNRRSSIRVMLKYIAKSNIASIDTRQLQMIFVDLFNKNKSKSLMSNARVTANFIFKYAVEHKLRTDNPLNGVIIPKKQLTVEEIESDTVKEKYFERYELEEFLQTCLTDGLHLDKEWF